MLSQINCHISKTWLITKIDENNLIIFKREILRKIYGPRKNATTNDNVTRKNIDENI